MSYVFSKGGHVRVTLISDKLPDKVNMVLSIIYNIISAIIFILIAFGSYGRTVRAIQTNELSSSVWAYPLAPAYFIVVIGSVLLVMRFVEAAFRRKTF